VPKHKREQPRDVRRRQDLRYPAKTGEVTAFIPDPIEKSSGTSAAEGVAADAMGNIYGAEVGPTRLMRYVRN
jgi:hypothetical protein